MRFSLFLNGIFASCFSVGMVSAWDLLERIIFIAFHSIYDYFLFSEMNGEYFVLFIFDFQGEASRWSKVSS